MGVWAVNSKLPYYMAYPMPLVYDDEKIERRDFEYMKSMYPEMAKQVLPYVEDECDRMSYAGSMIYDEYPDRLQMHLMCNRICDKVKQDGTEDNAKLREMVEVLMFHEIYKRRCDNRKQRRNFYFN